MNITEKHTTSFKQSEYLRNNLTTLEDKIERLLTGREAESASAGAITSFESWDIRELKLREVVKSEIESALRPIQRKLDKLDLIENQLNEISKLVSQEVEQEAIIFRDISREQAKAEIEELFRNTTDSLYYSDIMEQLGIDLELVVSVCNKLLDEGKIEYGDEGARTISRRSND